MQRVGLLSAVQLTARPITIVVYVCRPCSNLKICPDYWSDIVCILTVLRPNSVALSSSRAGLRPASELDSEMEFGLYLHKYFIFELFGLMTTNLKFFTYYIVWTKRNSSLSRYNSGTRESSLITLDLNVTEKVRNEKVLYFPTSPN